MSKARAHRQDPEDEQDIEIALSDVAPAVTAADAGPSARNVVRFDEDLKKPIEIMAEERSVGTNPGEVADHVLGVGTEVATAVWADGDIDTEIYPDYEGDDGYDIVAGPQWGPEPTRIEVKGTRDIDNPERVISRDEIAQIDYAVLCCSKRPSERVDIVGYAPRGLLELAPDSYNQDGPLLQEEILYPMSGKRYFPSDVREVVCDLDCWRTDATHEVEAV